MPADRRERREPARGSGQGFRADVQGLRALAVLAVVAYHAGVPGLPGGYVGVDVFFVISGFLITGLLWRELAGTGRLGLPGFYARRARRLLPAAVLVLVVTLATADWLLPPLEVPGTAGDAAAAALYALNYRLALRGTDYLDASAPPSPVQHYWSLGVEEQFYLLWPLLLLLAVTLTRHTPPGPRSGPGRRTGPATAPSRRAAALALVGLGAASFLLSLELTRTSQPWAFYSLPTRAWELAAGGVLALTTPLAARVHPALAAVLGWAGIGAVLLAVVRLGATTPFPGLAALLPVTGAAAVLAAGCVPTRWGPRALLDRPPLQAVGALSYSWYLWHWPLLVLGATWSVRPLARAILVLASLLLAAATTRWVETPLRTAAVLGRSPRRSLVLAGALTAAAVLTAVGVGTLAQARLGGTGHLAAPVLSDSGPGDPVPSQGPAGPGMGAVPPAVPAPAITQQAALQAAQGRLAAAVSQGVGTSDVPVNLTPSLTHARRDQQVPFLDGCDLGFTQSTPPPCTFAVTTSATRVVALGDSHAAQWFPALDATAQAQGWRLENLTKATCPPMALPIYSPVLHRAFTECQRFRASALTRIQAEHPALVVVDMARHYGPEYHFTVYSPTWLSSLHDLVAQLRATGTQVLVLGPTPKPPGDLPTCLSAHPHDVPACARPLPAEVDATGAQAERSATVSAGGSYLDVAPWMCTNSTCAAIVGNLLVFRDDNHLTNTYATWLTPVVTAALTAAIQGPLPATP